MDNHKPKKDCMPEIIPFQKDHMEDKAKTLITVALDFLLVQHLEKHGSGRHEQFVKDIERQFADTMNELEELYTVDKGAVIPRLDVMRIKSILGEIELPPDVFQGAV